jgi:septum formation inhibitor MinC
VGNACPNDRDRTEARLGIVKDCKPGEFFMKDDDFFLDDPTLEEDLKLEKQSSQPKLLRAVVDALVSARGTAEGLTIRLDARAEAEVLRQALIEFVESRKSFLKGNEVTLEWVGKQIDEQLLRGIKQDLLASFDIVVTKSYVQGSAPLSSRESEQLDSRQDVHEEDTSSQRSSLLARIRGTASRRPASLFDGVEVFTEVNSSDSRLSVAGRSSSQVPDASIRGREYQGGSTSDMALFDEWDDADARIIFQTLRGGQKVETEHSLVICGDVNSGAEIVAGGDIIVLGTLRGVAHAGAYDETGGGRFIFSLDLRPTQLRIGRVISRGSTDISKRPEIARVEGSVIVVEPYQSRARLTRSGATKAELASVKEQFDVE